MRKLLFLLSVLSLLAALAACDLYGDKVLGNRIHGVPCAKLPTHAEAEAIVREHADVIERLKRIDGGGRIVVELAEPCPGRADLVIYFPSRKARREIDALIGAETFYGIPIRLINV